VQVDADLAAVHHGLGEEPAAEAELRLALLGALKPLVDPQCFHGPGEVEQCGRLLSSRAAPRAYGRVYGPGQGRLARVHLAAPAPRVALAPIARQGAATELEKEGISVEIIDPRTLVPLDKEIILNSVEKTGRLVVVDPAHKVCSAASEIISVVTEEGFWNLQAPPVKIAAEQVHIPFTPALEPLIFPDAEKIINAVKQTIE